MSKGSNPNQDIKIPALSRDAVIALSRATVPGPNCRHRDGFEKFLDPENDSYLLSELTPYFIMGPDHFLNAYAVMHGAYQLEDYEIVGAYCLEHIPMVMAAEKIFERDGFETEYFEDMRKRGFKLRDDNLVEYLFSCIGKIGRVMHINYSGPSTFNTALIHVRVDGRFLALKNVVLPNYPVIRSDDLVAVHFASAFAKVSKENAKAIDASQLTIPKKSPFLLQLAPKLPNEIDYTSFLGQDLTKYTIDKLSPK
jgi:hypothetical protein